jgi:hypothetical protein
MAVASGTRVSRRARISRAPRAQTRATAGAGQGAPPSTAAPQDTKHGQRQICHHLRTRVTVPQTSIYLVFPHNNPPRRVAEFVKKIMQFHEAKRGD